MTLLALLGLVPTLLGMAMQGPSQASRPEGVRRTVIHEQLIISVPVRPRQSQRIEWTEKKGPKCVPVGRVVGATLSGPSSIDFMLRDRSRVRALFDNECPALDFYKGFYLQPEDERICAKRETIRNRVGATCRIEKFRMLVPQVKQVRR